jgi:hypothetical protein
LSGGDSYRARTVHIGTATGGPPRGLPSTKESTTKTCIHLERLLALAGAVALPAAATSGFTQIRGDAGFSTHAMPAANTRSDVLQESAAWRRIPVTADGWREVGGATGSVFVGTDSAGKTRAAGIDEMMRARRDTGSASGWPNGGGEVGAVELHGQ